MTPNARLKQLQDENEKLKDKLIESQMAFAEAHEEIKRLEGLGEKYRKLIKQLLGDKD